MTFARTPWRAAFGALAALCLAADSNPRWDFLRMNLQVFPGTDKIFEPDPRLFWKLKPNLSRIQAAEKLPDREYPFRVSTDSNGRRLTPAAPDGAPEALFLGDSCTFGIPVNDDEAFPSQAAQAVKMKAINAGVPGYSVFQGRLLLEAAAVRPRFVVITFWLNDRTSWDNLSDREHFELLAAERAGEFSRLNLLRILRRAAAPRPRLDDGEFEQELTATVETARRIGAVPVLVIWPYARQIAGEPEEPRQGIIRRVGSKANVRVVDLAPRFRQHRGRDLFADAVHATSAGYRIAGAAVAEALRAAAGDQAGRRE